MNRKYKIVNYEKICNEVMKEVIFSLEKKLIESQDVTNLPKSKKPKTRKKPIQTEATNPPQIKKPRQRDWSDIEFYKNRIKEALSDKMDEFKIHGFRDGDKKNELIVVYKNPGERYLNFRKVYNFLSNLPDVESIGDLFKRKSIIPFSQINFLHKSSTQNVPNSIKTIEVGHKFEQKSTWGLAQENILAYILDPTQANKLTKNLGQPTGKTSKEIDELLATDEWVAMRDMALSAKNEIENKFGPIKSAQVVGGKGGKEDIIITPVQPWDSGLGKEWDQIYISSKLALSGKNPFIANIDLGDGIQTTSTFPVRDAQGNVINLIPNDNNVPWWQTVRTSLSDNLLKKTEYKNLKEEISNYINFLKIPQSDTKIPNWLREAYQEDSSNYTDYKSILSAFYANLRKVFNRELNRLSKEDLATIVRYAYYGKRTEESPPLFKITMSPTSAKLEQVTEMVPWAADDDNAQEQVTPMIRAQGRLEGQTIIAIPGMNPMIIGGLKFRSTVMSSKRSDLNIKTRA